MDGWYREVYQARTGYTMYTEKGALYQRFLDTFEDLVHKEVDSIHKLSMMSAMARIKDKFNDRPSDWVDLAVSCIEREHKLMDRHRKICQQAALEQCIEQADQKVEDNIDNAKQLQKRIVECIEGKATAWRNLLSAQVKPDHFIYIQDAGSTIPDQQYLETEIQRNDIHGAIEQVTGQHQDLVQMFQEAYVILNRLVNDLQEKVQEWRMQFKLEYAELAASPNLQRLAPRCASTGRILYDVLHVNLKCWQNIVSNFPKDNSTQMLMNECETQQHAFQSMLTGFLQSTFLVTEQGNFFIRKGNKQFPKLTVRILAADRFPGHCEDVTAHFVSEGDLKACCHNGEPDLQKMKAAEKKLTTSKLKLTASEGKDKMECSFMKLQFESSFKRLQSNKEMNKQVHEEKYRVIFVTTIESSQIWTMSLPLVVLTASNQEARSLASIMWQCYSTDVFNPTVSVPEKLPWSTVAKMLQTKMSRLSSIQGLSDVNITHLKNRLFGEENKSDDTAVTLNQFCWNHMVDTDFSFWRWFLGIYNLIDQYLRQFWTEGLIMGFVKKEEAEKMLGTCDKAGTFILRFSDKHYTNSDGLKSVYGRLTSCVLVMKETTGSKRQSLGQPKLVKVPVIEHVDVADFKKLGGEVKKIDNVDCCRNNLADILKQTWIKGRDGKNQVQMYCHLFPGDQSREELFDKYCAKDKYTPMTGYRHTTEAYVACIEQDFMEVNLGTQSTSSVSVDIDSCSKLGQANVKKSRQCPERANTSPRHSTNCRSTKSTPQGSPLSVQSPLNTNQSPRSNNPPASSPAYPEHYYSPQFSSQHCQQELIPKVIDEKCQATSIISRNVLSVSDRLPDVDTVGIVESSAIWGTSAANPDIQGNPPPEQLVNSAGLSYTTGSTLVNSASMGGANISVGVSRQIGGGNMPVYVNSLLGSPDQVVMEIDVQTLPVTESTNVPVCTSSGSSGELGYSGKQLAALDSGDINSGWLCDGGAYLDIFEEN